MNIPKHFKQAMTTLRKVSYDDSNKIYMSNSELTVYDFDAIKEWYASKLSIDGNKLDVKSNDSLYVSAGKIVFIEFKNGKLDKGEMKRDLVRKIYDSYIILSDEVTETKGIIEGYKPSVTFSREHIDYILVYNEEKNPPSKKNIIRHGYLGKGNMGIPARFGLFRFEGYLFRKVKTYTELEFQNDFVAKVDNSDVIVQ